MFLESFRTTFSAIFELALMGLVGYILVRRSIISDESLSCLNRLVISLFLPLFMFSEIIKRFTFSAHSDWWIYPLLSFLVTGAGYGLGLLGGVDCHDSPFIQFATFLPF